MISLTTIIPDIATTVRKISILQIPPPNNILEPAFHTVYEEFQKHKHITNTVIANGIL